MMMYLYQYFLSVPFHEVRAQHIARRPPTYSAPPELQSSVFHRLFHDANTSYRLRSSAH